jgi:hypothetical protein
VVEARRTFAPVVVAAGMASGVVAWAGIQPWHVPTGTGAYRCDAPCVGSSYDAGNGWSFGLVMLACLGVVLVSRGRLRRLACIVGLLAAIGAVVAVVESFVNGAEEVRDLVQQVGASAPDVSTTGWFWIGAVGSVAGVLAWLAAVAYVTSWPEMGQRYDRPQSDAPEDLWKAMDHGHDPTS